MIKTNISSLMHLTHQVLKGMVARDSGHIVNIGSIAGSWPYPGGNVYGATKAFVAQFSRGLRADLLGQRIRVTNIEPGLAETNFSLVRYKGDADKARQVYAGTEPLTGRDVADIVFWTTAVPPHVNINSVEVMPTFQTWGPLAVDRGTAED
jgi:NADP-dependent 3-hydroxy acid dehydrogenase YdfG